MYFSYLVIIAYKYNFSVLHFNLKSGPEVSGHLDVVINKTVVLAINESGQHKRKVVKMSLLCIDKIC